MNNIPFYDIDEFEQVGISTYEELAVYCDLNDLEIKPLCVFILKSYDEIIKTYGAAMMFFELIKSRYINTRRLIVSIYHNIGVNEPLFIPYIRKILSFIDFETFTCPKELKMSPKRFFSENDTIRKIIFNDSIQHIHLPIAEKCNNLEEIVFPRECPNEGLFFRRETEKSCLFRKCPSIKRIVVPDNAIIGMKDNNQFSLVIPSNLTPLFNDISLEQEVLLDIKTMDIVYHNGASVRVDNDN